MNVKPYLLASASVLLMAAYGTAHAQTTDTTAQTTTTDAAKKDKGAKPDADSVVVVKGYRASMRSALQIKKQSDSIVDAIVAEDIGKLPDNNAAESLARLPGVQITHYSDEGSGVLVRGLPDVATTVNGRDISTAELRRVQMQDFPSGALAALEVYKSGTADLLEPGLAGLINVRTRRPFDFKGFEMDGAFRETYNDQNGKMDVNGNVLISDRWNTPVGEMGALVNLSYTEQNYRNAVRWADGWIVTANSGQTITPASAGNTFNYSSGVGTYMDSGLRWRPSANAAFQWKVSDHLELYAELLWQAYRGKGAADWTRMSLNDATTLSNVVLDPLYSNQALSFTKSGGGVGDFYRSTGKGRTDTSQVAFGAVYNDGRLKATTDFAYTDSIYASESWSIDSEFKDAPTVDVTFRADDPNGGAAFNVTNINLSDPASYIWRGYYQSKYKTEGHGIQWRGDIVYQTDWGIIKNVKAGLRYTDRSAYLRNGNRYAWTLPLALPFAATPFGDLSLTEDTFRGNVQGFRQWLEPSIDGVQSHTKELEAYTIQALQQLVAKYPTDQGWKDTLANWQKPLDYNPLWGFTARESTRSAYAQVHYETRLFGVDADGDIGVRAVNTIGDYSGISSVTWNGSTQSVPRTSHQNYIDVLPNLSLRLRPTEQLQFRFAVTKTRTRPDFGALNPALNISQNVKTSTTPADAPDAYGSAGNPDLKPLTSTNYDATAEYYFSHTGSVSAAVFYRDLFGFISNYTRRVQDPTYGLIQVSRPENAGQGQIKGIEVGGQTFFDFLPGKWNGLGVQANVTYIEAKNRMPDTLGAFPDYVQIPGVSKWSYNLAVFYEKDKLSTRLSFNGRSGWINSYYQSSANGGFTGEGTDAVERLDYSLNYTLNPHLTLNFDISNILAVPFHNFSYYSPGRQFPRDIRDEGRYYGVALRWKL